MAGRRSPVIASLLRVSGIVRDFPGAVRVLGSVSLSVECGELVVVVGPSRGGESTLLQCLARVALILVNYP